ncbi:hypothetical protein SAMN04487926_12264 [Paraburkholderia steynii]|uniref:Restriction endonuclease type IV Mrr domain-containing protein n=1 Tax=Paraburkholderia steynii TaxID=1245441 RepID=A0A7Z7BCF9_9BURK|nr:hypothetical protein [Paraburkholderia steynii]SDI70756.1 hypothetical protein SAMN04487926_12264 [Paraburkholderia steynii]
MAETDNFDDISAERFARKGSREVHVSELLKFERSERIPLLDPMIDTLPYGDMAWSAFEKLCAHLLKESEDLHILQAFQYGEQGDEQDEIDILARRPGSTSFVMAQCKRVKTISPSLLSGWLAGFRASTSAKRCETYLLCVASRVTKPGVVNQWNQFAVALEQEDKIHAELWDAAELDQRLRVLPGVVSRFFGVDYARRFCQFELSQDDFPAQFATEDEYLFDDQLTLQNRTVHASISLPSKRYPYCGAILSFARKDLTGISFSVTCKEFVGWMQWRNCAPNEDERPYARQPTVSAGKFVLAAGGVRLTLGDEEIEHLDWILRRAWPRFLEASQQLDRTWRFLRFPRFRDTEVGFSVMRASRQTWAHILEFARAFDFANGTTDRHVFDASSGMLKVYTEHPRGDLAEGYHLLLRAVSEPGVTLPWEGDVILVWEPPHGIAQCSERVGPEHMWDAEFTHDWILNVMSKWVHEWLAKRTVHNTRLRSLFVEKQQNFACDLTSLPILSRRNIGAVATVADLRDWVRYYQAYFHCYRGAPIPQKTVCDVLHLVARHLRHADSDGLKFIRMRLHLGDRDLAQDIERLITLSEDAFIERRLNLDSALRCLLIIMEKEPDLPRSELDHASDSLRAVSGRVREDLLCSAFSMAGLAG